IMILSLIAEAAGPALVSIWFSVGALIALILTFIPGVPYWVEIIAFLVGSVATFLLIRPIVKKIMKKRLIRTNADAFIGSRGIMKLGADALNAGEVEIRGAIWTAVPAKEGLTIKEGSIVTIVAIEGNKLLVEPIKEEN
ncbi:MAG: NfeD family protein, partial [Bacilli bacterium]|nr:NfeD family protein [Bacilli bacterium]